MATFKHKTKAGKEITVNIDAVDRRSAENLKKTPDGGEVPYKAMKGFVMIGPGHDSNAVEVMTDIKANHAELYKEGKITIKKGNWTGSNPGELDVTGCRSEQAEFKQRLGTYTKKKIMFK